MTDLADSPRFFVMGCGSIGRRHIGNLLELGVKDVIAFDIREDRRAQVEEQFGIPTVPTVDQGWELGPQVALIATPTSLHLPLALEAAGHGCHLFIEKPLGDRMEGVDELISAALPQELTALVGCNMRFHHGPATIKGLLDQGAIGRIIAVLLDAGQYLPDWHPGEDYRGWYSASASLGGGVVLDGIHEIDYARWLFGEVSEVYCQGGKLSSLEIDTEDSINILMKQVAGFSVAIHMDYVQRTYSRTCKVIGEEGTILWDLSQSSVRLYSAKENGWQTFSEPQGYSINQMYLDEMEHFLRCVRGEEEPCLGLREAGKVLEIALAIKDSMHNGHSIKVAA